MDDREERSELPLHVEQCHGTLGSLIAVLKIRTFEDIAPTGDT